MRALNLQGLSHGRMRRLIGHLATLPGSYRDPFSTTRTSTSLGAESARSGVSKNSTEKINLIWSWIAITQRYIIKNRNSNYAKRGRWENNPRVIASARKRSRPSESTGLVQDTIVHRDKKTAIDADSTMKWLCDIEATGDDVAGQLQRLKAEIVKAANLGWPTR